jgi:hypothetical protein
LNEQHDRAYPPASTLGTKLFVGALFVTVASFIGYFALSLWEGSHEPLCPPHRYDALIETLRTVFTSGAGALIGSAFAGHNNRGRD